jgi:hypothetical protein
MADLAASPDLPSLHITIVIAAVADRRSPSLLLMLIAIAAADVDRHRCC